MKVKNFFFEEYAMGIPIASFRVLRDSIACAYKHALAVTQIATSKTSCGFLILDADHKSATFTGDGFSIIQDAGENSNAFLSAQALFIFFTIKPILGPQVCLQPAMEYLQKQESQLALEYMRQIFMPIVEAVPDDQFSESFSRKPQLLRVIQPSKPKVGIIMSSLN